MRVAFFHGLESKPNSEKNQILNKTFDYVYAPAMDYHNSNLFDTVLQGVKDNNIQLLIGSSMGGYFAYCISTLTGIPTILFNPAVVNRSFNPVTKVGSQKAHHTVVYGENDDIINPEKSQEWFKKYGVGSFKYYWENMGHKIPSNIFRKYISVKESTGYVKLYEEWLYESDIIYGRDIIKQNQGLSSSEDGSAFIGGSDKFEKITIPLKEVDNKAIYSWYVKRGLDEDVVMIDRLIAKIRSGVKLHPIVLDKKNKILDGNHRFVAYRKLGYKEIEVYREL